MHINYAQYQVKVALVKLTLTVLSLSPSLCSARLCSRTSAAAAAVIAATSKTTNKARFGAGRGNFVDFYDCLLCGIGCCADWLPVGWGQMKMENSNGNGNDEWTTTGVGEGKGICWRMETESCLAAFNTNASFHAISNPNSI